MSNIKKEILNIAKSICKESFNSSFLIILIQLEVNINHVKYN